MKKYALLSLFFVALVTTGGTCKKEEAPANAPVESSAAPAAAPADAAPAAGGEAEGMGESSEVKEGAHE